MAGEPQKVSAGIGPCGIPAHGQHRWPSRRSLPATLSTGNVGSFSGYAASMRSGAPMANLNSRPKPSLTVSPTRKPHVDTEGMKRAHDTSQLESAQPDGVHGMLCQLVASAAWSESFESCEGSSPSALSRCHPVTRLPSGQCESPDSSVGSSPSEILKTLSCRINHSRSPTHRNERVNVSEFAWTDRTSNTCDARKEGTSLRKSFTAIIDQLKDAMKKDAEECEARLERMVHAGLHDIAWKSQEIWQAKFERARDIWQTNFETRLCALEEDKQGHVKKFTDFDNRLSALEEHVCALPELRPLQQHSCDLEVEVARMKTDIDKNMYRLEVRVGQLQETLHQHKTAYHEDFTNLKVSFDDKIDVLEKDTSSVSCKQIGQRVMLHEPKKAQPMTNRLGKLEGSIDLIASVLKNMDARLSGGTQEVLASETANGSSVGLNNASAGSTSMASLSN